MKQKHKALCMLFQPIVINHSYFIRHLKRWMICANEISIIYGGRKKACARAGQHNVFLLFLPKADEKKPNLRFVFIVFYVYRERELSTFVSVSAALLKRDRKKLSALRLRHQKNCWELQCFTTTTTERFVKIYSGLHRKRKKRNKFRHIYARKIKLLEFMT